MRAAIFSIGCVLLEMLTGRRAFTGDTPADLISAILMKDPLESVSFAIPPAVARIIRHCLEKTPEERFQSAQDVSFALSDLLNSSPSVESRSAPSTRRVHPVYWIAAIAAVMLAAVSFYWLRGSSGKTHILTDKDTIVLADFTNTTGDAVFDDTLKQALVASGSRHLPPATVLALREVRATRLWRRWSVEVVHAVFRRRSSSSARNQSS